MLDCIRTMNLKIKLELTAQALRIASNILADVPQACLPLETRESFQLVLRTLNTMEMDVRSALVKAS